MSSKLNRAIKKNVENLPFQQLGTSPVFVVHLHRSWFSHVLLYIILELLLESFREDQQHSLTRDNEIAKCF